MKVQKEMRHGQPSFLIRFKYVRLLESKSRRPLQMKMNISWEDSSIDSTSVYTKNYRDHLSLLQTHSLYRIKCYDYWKLKRRENKSKKTPPTPEQKVYIWWYVSMRMSQIKQLMYSGRPSFIYICLTNS